jgi:hypothetical protein
LQAETHLVSSSPASPSPCAPASTRREGHVVIGGEGWHQVVGLEDEPVQTEAHPEASTQEARQLIPPASPTQNRGEHVSGWTGGSSSPLTGGSHHSRTSPELAVVLTGFSAWKARGPRRNRQLADLDHGSRIRGGLVALRISAMVGAPTQMVTHQGRPMSQPGRPWASRPPHGGGNGSLANDGSGGGTITAWARGASRGRVGPYSLRVVSSGRSRPLR